ncbi:phosphotransferase [Paenibacillus larvae]|nr:phosphotransferase [Paenibacillus larvae]MDT2241959.1 phosphotransferase [Paenibacillus larvae]MDT2247762.1 phosphotransferase [Paenibacillus larvae]MDT2264198.1 phosphotransferase [Paenibacillus larvae]MDT2285050.1 phosphotransferase [Paenibacillus larvae]MDT2305218.1 phosphotransferase [Paenibacillus larvae]
MEEEINHPALIHGDVTLPNIIIHPSRPFLIDWDLLRMGSTYYETAKTLLNTTNFDPANISALIKGYEQIKGLTPAERLLISAFFAFLSRHGDQPGGLRQAGVRRFFIF